MENIAIQTQTVTGSRPGPRVAIFCGVHGNEKAGIAVVDFLCRNLQLTAGEVVLVYANPPAIEANQRLINQNVNRLCMRGKAIESYENVIAEQLMDVLDTCDALLDLHAYNEPNGDSIPFLICEEDCLDITQKMDFGIVATGFGAIEPGGTDGYMFEQGKVGITAELGAIERPQDFVELGIKTAYQFMQHFGLVETLYEFDEVEQVHLVADYIYKRTSEDFSFNRPFMTFDCVVAEETIAIDGGVACQSPYNGRIIFPRSTLPIGVEAFIVAREV